MPIAWVSPPKWEYLIERFPGDMDAIEVGAMCNERGGQGWELVTVDVSTRLAWFKRMIPKEPSDDDE
jgi:hypothetical protein